MRRREYLCAGAALIGSGTIGSATRTTAADEYGPLGSVAVSEAKEAVVGDGDWVYLATTDGYAVVDVGDPVDPAVVAAVDYVGPPDGGALRQIYDVKYDDDRLLVAGQGLRDRTTLGFAVVDVSDPTAPEQALFQELEFSVHNCVLDGDVAYLTSGPDDRDTFTVYDVSGGTATELTTWRAVEANEAWEQAASDGGGPGAHDLWVHDGLAYTASWNAGVFVVDVSDPANPEYVGEFGGFDPGELASMSEKQRGLQVARPPGNAHYVATDPAGDLLGVGGEAWKSEGEGGPMGIDLYDVSDPADPEQLSTIDPPESPDPTMDGILTTAHNFEIRDGTLYSSWYQGGVKRHDVSDPTDPVEETWWRRHYDTSFWTARVLEPGESFVASSKGVSNVGFGALYVFPDEEGRSVTPYDATPTPTATPPQTATPTPSATATSTDSSRASTTPTGAGESSPGFGPLAALAGLGLGTWRYVRHGD